MCLEIVVKVFQRTKAASDSTEHPLGRKIAHRIIVLMGIAQPDPSNLIIKLRLNQDDQAILDGLQVLAGCTKVQIRRLCPGNAMEAIAPRA